MGVRKFTDSYGRRAWASTHVDVVVGAEGGTLGQMIPKGTNKDNQLINKSELDAKSDTKQDTLVSGENIKTINGESIIGSGGIIISGETIQVDAVPTKNSPNPVNSGGVFNELVLGNVYDVSAHNDRATFASLSALLSAANLDTLIPTDVRKGGMSIKFVQTSDNKYVQYRLMADEFTTDTTQWAIANEDVYVESPEYVYVKTDKEGKILWAIKIDGGIYYGVGVPQQVIDYIEERIAELSLDEYEDIVAFLSDYLGSDTTLKAIVDGINAQIVTKVDKVEGKSLIDAEFADGVSQTENPEFVEAHTDTESKILYGVKPDGDFYFGAGVPSQVQEELDKVAEDVANKVDKEEGKSLIDTEYASSQSAIDNSEYLQVTTDNDDKILEGIKQDGTKVIGADLEVGGDVKILGDMEVSGVVYKVVENPEYLAAWVDAEGKLIFGIKTDGKTYVGDADFLDDIESIKLFLANFEDKDIDWDALTSITATENPEYIKVEIDVQGKVLAGRTPNGAAFENVGLSTPKLSINDIQHFTITDPEDRISITTDSTDKVVSYRKSDGTLVENVGIETKKIESDSFKLPEDTIEEVRDVTRIPAPKNYNLPKFGTVNIKTETFYLTKNNGYSDKYGIVLIQMFADTVANANAKKTLSYFYVKDANITGTGSDGLSYTGDLVSRVGNKYYVTSSLDGGSVIETSIEVTFNSASVTEGISTKLDFYAASLITEVEGHYYVTSSLEPGKTQIEVTEITDNVPVRAWVVDKNIEHYCIGDIDFGHYLTKENSPLGVKYQGSSTLEARKRNFRITFYKNSSYSKKDKIKIGEMVRLSGYNLKANWYDSTRIKEAVMYRVLEAVWEHRDTYDQYPWSKEHTPFTGATGMIKGFPIEYRINDDFYGLYIFGLKKDGKNYILDKDEDGMIEGGTRNYSGWIDAHPIDWEDELNDEEDWVIGHQTQSNFDALTEFFNFINERLYKGSDNNTYNNTQLTEVDGTMYVTSTLEGGVPVEGSVSATLISFNKKTMPERMSMIDWIDYLVCLQVFLMQDNTCRNMMLYTGSDKKKFYPFFYDLDLCAGFSNTTGDIMIPRDEQHPTGWGSYSDDMSLWENIKSEWWDEIINRYHELRNNILTADYIKSVAKDILNGIPQSVFESEEERWGVQLRDFYSRVDTLERRMLNLDTTYYI